MPHFPHKIRHHNWKNMNFAASVKTMEKKFIMSPKYASAEYTNEQIEKKVRTVHNNSRKRIHCMKWSIRFPLVGTLLPFYAYENTLQAASAYRKMAFSRMCTRVTEKNVPSMANQPGEKKIS